MRPTSREIIEGIVAAIDTTILPAVEEKQAASSLRAARTLLVHLAARVDVEGDILIADNADAEETIGEILARDAATFPRLAHALAARSDDRCLATLQVRNEALQEAVDQTLRALPRAGSEAPPEADARKALRAYLARRHARERDLVFPAFLGTPF